MTTKQRAETWWLKTKIKLVYWSMSVEDQSTLVHELAELLEERDAALERETKACSHWFKEANQEHNDNERLKSRIAELEADRDVYKDPGFIEGIAKAARVEGLRRAMQLAQGEQYAFEVVTKIDAEIAALEGK